MAVGSGMRPDVWREFLRRFGDVHVVETYGMTEGNVCFFNYTGTLGAVGRSTWLYKVRTEGLPVAPKVVGGMGRGGKDPGLGHKGLRLNCLCLRATR